MSCSTDGTHRLHMCAGETQACARALVLAFVGIEREPTAAGRGSWSQHREIVEARRKVPGLGPVQPVVPKG